MPELEYGWKRFWSERGTALNYDQDGFLIDPEAKDARHYSSVASSLQDVSDVPCIVLLGAPGIGKSRFLRSSFEEARSTLKASDVAVWNHLRDFTSESRLVEKVFKSDDVQNWLKGTGRLFMFLDGFDEGLLRIDSIAGTLASELAEIPRERLSLRVACRPGDWPLSFERRLIELWPQGTRIMEMAPLRRIDVKMAASAHGLGTTDSEAFLAEVVERGVVPLAIAPVTLGSLLDLFKRDRKLPPTRAEVYFEGCKLLAEELEERQETPRGRANLTSLQKLKVAGRVAAFTQLSNRVGVTQLSHGQPEEVGAEAILGGEEGEENSMVTLDLPVIREVLDSGLFTSPRANLHVWRHQSYGEYLCAYHLHTRLLDIGALQTLTFHQDDSGRVIPQLREVVRWLASMDEDFLKLVARHDAATLLQADLTNASETDRVVIAENLLEAFDAIEVADSMWHLRGDFHRLKSPQLAKLLDEFISNKTRRIHSRLAAIEMARMCQMTILAERLLHLALDRAEPTEIRGHASSVFAEFAPDQHEALTPLALENVGEDPDDELKGIALAACWPRHISASQLFAVLAPPKRSNYLGHYRSFIGSDIAEKLVEADLVPALKWAKEVRDHGDYDGTGKLATDIIAMAADFLTQPTIRALFADILLDRASRYELGDRVRAKVRALADDVRSALARAMLPMAASMKHGEMFLTDACLIQGRDIHWLLNELDQGPPVEEQKVLSWIVSRLVTNVDVDGFTAILVAAKSNAILAHEIESTLQPVDINSAQAEEQKKYWKLSTRQDSPPAEQKVTSPIETIHSAFVRVGEDQFFHIFWGLYRNHENGASNEPLPGWTELTPALKSAIVDAAILVLQTPPPQPPGKWWMQGPLNWGMLAGSKALNVLGAVSHEHLTRLNDGVWETWGPIYLSVDISGDASLRALILAEACSRRPVAFCARLDDHITAENEQLGDSANTIRRLSGVWNLELPSVPT